MSESSISVGVNGRCVCEREGNGITVVFIPAGCLFLQPVQF